MARWTPALVLLCGLPLLAQEAQPQLKKRDSAPEKSQSAVPPEEDKSLSVRDYGFNPVQAQKEIRTGNYYYKKGSYRAAAGRYEEATKWNNGDPEAWLRLGEASEKLKDKKAAAEAYNKYLELASDGKNADEVRKKLEKLK